MVCSDFLGLSADEQVEAMATAQLGEGAEPAPAVAPDEETAAAVVAACTESGDMMLGPALRLVRATLLGFADSVSVPGARLVAAGATYRSAVAKA
jgi:hypothetical protein